MENPTTEAAARYALRPSLNHLTQSDLETLRTWNSSKRVLPELTEEERIAVTEVAIRVAIDNARIEKGQQIFNQAYSKKISQAPQFPHLFREDFRDIVVKIGNARAFDKRWPDSFKVDDQNRGIINTLAMYFTEDIGFVKVNPSFSLDKGILLIGPIGCGKTELMRICNENPKLSYSQHDCQDIVEQYSTKDIGPAVFDEYGRNPVNTSRDKYFGQSQLGRFFDDLGAEPLGKHMGNERNVMGEIIQIRHKKYPHNFTHFTSNLAIDDLEAFYGARVADRLREMCNVITYPSTAKSRRR